jgi:hypothetical protein
MPYQAVLFFSIPGLCLYPLRILTMPVRIIWLLMFLVSPLFSGNTSTWAAEASMNAKQFPTGYFYKYQKIPIPEKEKVLAKIDATLKKLNQEGYGLIAKGAVIGKLGPETKIYEKLTILDESGLIIMVHQVPNLYYQYPGQAGINPNLYLILKQARVNFPESYIRYAYVVEGDFVGYADKFVHAILGGLERENTGGRQPVPTRPKASPSR